MDFSQSLANAPAIRSSGTGPSLSTENINKAAVVSLEPRMGKALNGISITTALGE